MKLWGALLMCLGGIAAGLRVSGRIRKRLESLSDLAETMALAARLLNSFSMPTGELVRQLTAFAPGCGAILFGKIQEKMERADGSMLSLWEESTEMLAPREQAVLRSFGRTLGRYDAAEQAQTALLCREELAAMEKSLREKYEREKGLPVALGAAAGALVSLVML